MQIAGQDQAGGVAVIGISPYRHFDNNYRSFIDLAVGHLATGISNANAYSIPPGHPNRGENYLR